MALRRGFKSEANYYARELRRDLGIAFHAPLSPWRLARHLDVPVFELSDFVRINARAAYLLTSDGAREFSGATICWGYRRLIIVNDGHSKKRQASDLSHELSHCVLHHRPRPDAELNGVRSYDPAQEEEANWLGPALLISEEAALWIARQGMSKSEASDHYSATEEVVQMRLNLTGAYKRVRQ
jgi:Zn-dependent peptidase ImmA (M78 family)